MILLLHLHFHLHLTPFFALHTPPVISQSVACYHCTDSQQPGVFHRGPSLSSSPQSTSLAPASPVPSRQSPVSPHLSPLVGFYLTFFLLFFSSSAHQPAQPSPPTNTPLQPLAPSICVHRPRDNVEYPHLHWLGLLMVMSLSFASTPNTTGEMIFFLCF